MWGTTGSRVPGKGGKSFGLTSIIFPLLQCSMEPTAPLCQIGVMRRQPILKVTKNPHNVSLDLSNEFFPLINVLLHRRCTEEDLHARVRCLKLLQTARQEICKNSGWDKRWGYLCLFEDSCNDLNSSANPWAAAMDNAEQLFIYTQASKFEVRFWRRKKLFIEQRSIQLFRSYSKGL